MSRTQTNLALLALGLLAGACRWDEGLIIENMVGTVVIPADLVTRQQVVNGVPTDVPDVKNIGPVFLGLYPGTVEADVTTTYPYVVTGPAFNLERGVGDAYPYGGTTIGRLGNTCLEALQCRVTTGRFKSYDELLEWVSKFEEVVDYVGDPITTGEELRQTCMAAFDFTTDEELGLVATDRNDDGVVDEMDLDFKLREDGNYEAEFTFWQQEYFTDPTGEQGFTLWGFMDAPAVGTGKLGACTDATNFGQNPDSYTQPVYNVAIMPRNVLNAPASYIDPGDVVAGVQDQDGGEGTIGYVYQDPDDQPELWLNFQVVQ